MTALAADAERLRRNDGSVKIATYVVTNAATVYKGGLVMFPSGAGTVSAGADTAGGRVAGIALETATGNAGGTVTCEVEYDAEYLFVSSAITGADAGLTAVIADDNTLTDAGAGTNDIPVGRIVEIPAANTCWVHVMQGVVA
jgi:hypothetical protein